MKQKEHTITQEDVGSKAYNYAYVKGLEEKLDYPHEEIAELQARVKELEAYHINEATCHACPCKLNFDGFKARVKELEAELDYARKRIVTLGERISSNATVKELETALKLLKCFKATTPKMQKAIDNALCYDSTLISNKETT